MRRSYFLRYPASCLRLLVLCLTLAAAAAPAYAFDSASIEFGSGNKTRLTRAGVQWKWASQWDAGENSQLSGFWDLSLANWRGNRYQDREGARQNLWAVGISPVIRLTSKQSRGIYFETGLGPHLLSGLYDNNGSQLSTSFQFGSHIALGYLFPNKVDVAVRYQHYSNGGIKDPNDGVNFLIVRFSYPF